MSPPAPQKQSYASFVTARYLLALAAMIAPLQAVDTAAGRTQGDRPFAGTPMCSPLEADHLSTGGSMRWRRRANPRTRSCEEASRDAGVPAPALHRAASGESSGCGSGSVSPLCGGSGAAWCARPAAGCVSARPPAKGTID